MEGADGDEVSNLNIGSVGEGSEGSNSPQSGDLSGREGYSVSVERYDVESRPLSLQSVDSSVSDLDVEGSSSEGDDHVKAHGVRLDGSGEGGARRDG